jgi:hypothetical protein
MTAKSAQKNNGNPQMNANHRKMLEITITLV